MDDVPDITETHFVSPMTISTTINATKIKDLQSKEIFCGFLKFSSNDTNTERKQFTRSINQSHRNCGDKTSSSIRVMLKHRLNKKSTEQNINQNCQMISDHNMHTKKKHTRYNLPDSSFVEHDGMSTTTERQTKHLGDLKGLLRHFIIENDRKNLIPNEMVVNRALKTKELKGKFYCFNYNMARNVSHKDLMDMYMRKHNSNNSQNPEGSSKEEHKNELCRVTASEKMQNDELYKEILSCLTMSCHCDCPTDSIVQEKEKRKRKKEILQKLRICEELSARLDEMSCKLKHTLHHRHHFSTDLCGRHHPHCHGHLHRKKYNTLSCLPSYYADLYPIYDEDELYFQDDCIPHLHVSHTCRRKKFSSDPSISSVDEDLSSLDDFPLAIWKSTKFL